MEKRIWEIVLTGGPCSGKSRGIKNLKRRLEKLGFRVFVINEVATRFIEGGISDMAKIAKEDPEKLYEIQRLILLEYIHERQSANRRANLFTDEKCIILFDRAAMDGASYIPREHFAAILEEECLTLHDVRDSYDGVVHLVTAADGAEPFYTTKNNKARYETTLEAAREQDKKTLAVWVGHPHLRIIDNSTGFKGKLDRLFKVVCRIIGYPTPLEIEKKFLLARRPDFRLKPLRSSEQIHIEQIYLDSPHDEEPRIRKRSPLSYGMGRSQESSSTYYQTRKVAVSPGVREERENIIPAWKYLCGREFQDPQTETVRKYRYYFAYKSQYFELDEFLEPGWTRGLWLLEIELTEEDDRIELPPFLDVAREVTNDPQYYTFKLAQKK